MAEIQELRAVNPILTDLSLAFTQPGFVGDIVLPPIPVAMETGTYPVWGKEKFRIAKNTRAAGDEYARLKSSVSTDTFVCSEFGEQRNIDDRERVQAIPVTNEDVTEELTEMHLLAREKRIVDLVTSIAVITQNSQPVPADKWGGANNKNPFTDVKTAKGVVQTATGRIPNLIVVSRAVWNVLSELPAFLDKVKYTQIGILSTELAARAFEVDKFLIADTIYDTAKEGQAASLTSLWGKDALLAYVSTGANVRTMSLGWSFTARTRKVQTYRDENTNSEVVRVSDVIVEKIASASCAYLFKGIVS